MKQFIPIEEKIYSFSNCDMCDARCCNGKEGTVFSQIILKDFHEVYTNFPILFTFGELGYLKPVVILTNGIEFCKYNKELKCSIYEERPTVCRTYPLSVNIDDNIYIDTFCPALNNKDNNTKIIAQNKKISKDFDNELFYNYQDKYVETFYEFDPFNKKEDFELAITIKGINFFKYIKDTDNSYMKMHLESIIHLQNKYFLKV